MGSIAKAGSSMVLRFTDRGITLLLSAGSVDSRGGVPVQRDIVLNRGSLIAISKTSQGMA